MRTMYSKKIWLFIQNLTLKEIMKDGVEVFLRIVLVLMLPNSLNWTELLSQDFSWDKLEFPIFHNLKVVGFLEFPDSTVSSFCKFSIGIFKSKSCLFFAIFTNKNPVVMGSLGVFLQFKLTDKLDTIRCTRIWLIISIHGSYKNVLYIWSMSAPA